jgi:hypothetical protein
VGNAGKPDKPPKTPKGVITDLGREPKTQFLLDPKYVSCDMQSVGFKHSSSVPPVINAVISDIIWEHGPISYVIDLVICQDDLMIED